MIFPDGTAAQAFSRLIATGDGAIYSFVLTPPPVPLEQLVEEARAGSREALERVLEAIQGNVYALSLRMLWHPEDARDARPKFLGLGGGGLLIESQPQRLLDDLVATPQHRAAPFFGLGVEHLEQFALRVVIGGDTIVEMAAVFSPERC